MHPMHQIGYILIAYTQNVRNNKLRTSIRNFAIQFERRENAAAAIVQPTGYKPGHQIQTHTENGASGQLKGNETKNVWQKMLIKILTLHLDV